MLSNNDARSTVKTTLVKALMAYAIVERVYINDKYSNRKRCKRISGYDRDITWVHFRSKSRTIGQYGKREQPRTESKLKFPLLYEWDLRRVVPAG